MLIGICSSHIAGGPVEGIRIHDTLNCVYLSVLQRGTNFLTHVSLDDEAFKIRSTLIIKNLLLRSKLFPLRVDAHLEGREKMKMAELLPLKVGQFTLMLFY